MTITTVCTKFPTDPRSGRARAGTSSTEPQHGTRQTTANRERRVAGASKSLDRQSEAVGIEDDIKNLVEDFRSFQLKHRGTVSIHAHHQD